MWVLPAQLVVSQMNALKAQALELAPDQADGQHVTEVDSAGLQLLIATAADARRRGVVFRVHTPSPALRAAVARAGLHHDLPEAS